MPSLRMRPTFCLDVPGRVDDVVARLREAITEPEFGGHAESAGRCLDFKIEPAERRFWSPHLGVQLSDATGERRPPTTELRGRFSPRPEVWTMVMMVYFGAVCLMFFAATFGYAQWALGTRPWALGFVPVGLVLMAGVHFAGLIGQRRSEGQMALLRSRLDRACEIAFGGGDG